jgi:hypothetical protein
MFTIFGFILDIIIIIALVVCLTLFILCGIPMLIGSITWYLCDKIWHRDDDEEEEEEEWQ